MPRSLAEIEKDLASLGEQLLPLARGSLFHAAMYASTAGSPHAERLLGLADEQSQLLERIVRARLIPFPVEDLNAARAWLDASIQRVHERDPLLARYWDLHQQRTLAFPALN